MGEPNTQDTTRKTLTAIVITKNEEGMIANCLACLRFADEIIVVDSGSSDNTVEIATREGATIVKASGGTFKDWRNLGLERATSDWVLYVDADERVTPKLADEIIYTIGLTPNAGLLLKRNNIHFGKWMEHGGWETDLLLRLFERKCLKGWEGDIHEHAEIKGTIGQIKEPLVHLTHRTIVDNLLKSASWTPIEARLLAESKIGPVKPFTLLRKIKMEFLRRLIFKKGYKDGMEGWIESLQQAFNRFLVYAQVWELQQKPPLEDRYQIMEKEILKMWEKKSST